MTATDPKAKRAELAKQINDVDKEIARLTEELSENTALRASLAAELDKVGPHPQHSTESPTAMVSVPNIPQPQRPPKPPTEKIKTKLLHSLLVNGRRYDRIMIATKDIPLDRYFVVVHEGTDIAEAHLGLRSIPFNGVVMCGWTVPRQGSWISERDDMDDEVELCLNCARRIPGVA